jgi:hypothetical protein
MKISQIGQLVKTNPIRTQTNPISNGVLAQAPAGILEFSTQKTADKKNHL